MGTIRTPTAKGAALNASEAEAIIKLPAVAQATSYALTAAHNREFHELANGITATLPTASGSLTETDDWYVALKAVGASATINTNSQNVDGSSADITLLENDVVTLAMNAAQTGFYIASLYRETLTLTSPTIISPTINTSATVNCDVDMNANDIVDVGKVGIGEATPDEALHITDATNAEVKLEDSGGTLGGDTRARVSFFAGADEHGLVGLDTGVGDMFLTNNQGDLVLRADENDAGPGATSIQFDIDAVRSVGLMKPTYFQYGNYKFNTNQTVGASQDDYVLGYNNSSGEIELERKQSSAYLDVISGGTSSQTLGSATGITSDIVKIEAIFSNVSLDTDAKEIYLELGDSTGWAASSGGVVASGPTTGNLWSGGPATVIGSAGLVAGDSFNGIVTLIRLNGDNRWILNSIICGAQHGADFHHGSGFIENSAGVVDRIRITCESAANFDNGSVEIRVTTE